MWPKEKQWWASHRVMGGKDSLMHMGSEGWPDLTDNGGTWPSLMNPIWMTGCIPECTCHQDLLWEKGKEAVWCFGQCSAGIMHPDTKPKRFRNGSRRTTVSMKCWPDLQIFQIFIKLCLFGMFWTNKYYEAPLCRLQNLKHVLLTSLCLITQHIFRGLKGVIRVLTQY